MRYLKISKNFRNALFVFIIAFSSFLAFEPLFEHLGQKASQEFTAAIFGTIFAAVITMVLLNKQTETEEERSRNEKVFEQKINLYNQIIEHLQTLYEKINNSNQVLVERVEITQIEFLLAKMTMIGNKKTIGEFKSLYKSIISSYNPSTKILTLNSNHKQGIFRFADYCREELGLSDKNLEKEIIEDIILQGELFYNLEQDNHPLEINTEFNIKDIYGFLVFDLNLPLENITFLPNGFQAYTNKNHTDTTCFLKCIIIDQEIHLNIPVNTSLNNFEKIDKNTIIIKASEREKVIRLQNTIEKAIRQSYEHLK